MDRVPAAELINRIKKFTTLMDMTDESWRYIFIFNPVNAYYLTGTMQDGVLFIQKDEEPVYFVKRCAGRAEKESRYCKIVPFKNYSEIKDKLTLNDYFPIYIDKKYITIEMLEKFNEEFNFDKILSCDKALTMCRSVKTKYEIDLLKKAGSIHKTIMEEKVPEILTESISEHEASLLIFNEFVKAGHQVITRFSKRNMEFETITTAFGENSLMTYKFNIPSGVEGIYTSAPFFGSKERLLKQNDLISITSSFGIEGYHSLSTYTYAHNSLIDYLRRQHEHCSTLKDIAVSMLKPGVIPADIYKEVMENIHPEIQGSFLGSEYNFTAQLGFGTGLTIDEAPVITKNNRIPLSENMVITLAFMAVVQGYGLTGMQHSYIVTNEGGISINGDNNNIIVTGKYL